MAARRRLGGQQISALLESLPGIASVLRSPVADAIVGLTRAGAGLGDFREADAKELVQYAVRRGLVGSQEGEELLAEVREAVKLARGAKRGRKKTAKRPTAKSGGRSSKAARVKGVKKSTTKKVTKKTVARRAKTIKTTKGAPAKTRKRKS